MDDQRIYILEVQEFIKEPLNLKGYHHRGYIKKLFNTKQDACDYYKLHNPHMRSINDKWCSDWDPITKLRYVVRLFNWEHLSLPSW